MMDCGWFWRFSFGWKARPLRVDIEDIGIRGIDHGKRKIVLGFSKDPRLVLEVYLVTGPDDSVAIIG
ncbi:hypothetical protein FRACYDRAFT_270337 [Fragilariopsis cylindrus CCMP1102]|uniref:Uncharacterized protein n=1 Tax=Fragilariopsis cylindrus CCMP1102 TaxID=635003 RepID=A0A1E7F4H2_9STRA|nr:hypothetical protein FRACYDRAFT_270337 [Fragilariopsis cylindrus CCMP1102]|eukprot:OEU13039.1 hypothetical protein FRACYDRAFT_270337 [Fragilariopsis cylindrus CCMP1102]